RTRPDDEIVRARSHLRVSLFLSRTCDTKSLPVGGSAFVVTSASPRGDRDHLLAFDFPCGQSVRLDCGSFALFRYAFQLADAELRELAVFTEHCGYHFFPLGERKIEVLQTVWPDDDSSRERVDGEP
ncbi:MAG TPA: hypothetical protein VM759_01985, partial [Longimicrobium sp.]|nr:hypothetical protein [Longimicrobium sp.]